MSEVFMTVKKSRKLQVVENGLWMKTFLTAFGIAFSKEWEDNSRSSKYWRIGIRKSKTKPAPIPNKLTERSGLLRESLKMGQANNISKMKVSDKELVVTRGVKASGKMMYAYRQEKQLGEQRSYLGRALDKTITKLNLIKKRATILTNGAFK